MGSSNPSLDLSATLKQVTEDTTNLPLQLTSWQKEYKEKLGLSSSSSESTTTHTNDTTYATNDSVLPFHPDPLGLEIERYKERLNQVKKLYIQLATKHRFLLSILQDPPQPVHPDQVKELDIKVLQQYGELTFRLRNLDKLKQAIAEGNAKTEKARQELMKTADTIIQCIDEIEEQKSTLTTLMAENYQYATLRTPDEAQRILEEQTKLLSEIHHGIDIKQDHVEELQDQLSHRLQEVEQLETISRQEDIKAKEAIRNTGRQNINVARQAAWYKEMTQLWHTAFGIKKVVDDIDLLEITFATGDVLSMYLDALTDQITGLEINNDSIDLSDLETMAIGKQIKDVASTVVLETLARTRQSSI